MPVLKNGGNTQVTVLDKTGAPRILNPGSTLETYFYSDHPSIVVLTDTPVWSRVISRADIDLAQIPLLYQSDIPGFSGAVVPVSSETEHVYVMKITGQVTVYKQSQAFEPEIKNRDDASPYIAIEAKGTMTRLLVSGSGEVEIVQYRRSI
jgi:hypothetical protein